MYTYTIMPRPPLVTTKELWEDLRDLGPMTVTELAEFYAISEKTVRGLLNQAIASGRVRSKYQNTETPGHPTKEYEFVFRRMSPAHPGCLRDRKGVKIDRIVLHRMQGSLEGTETWFKTADRPVMTATHYLIGDYGEVVQMVPDDKAALHAGNMEWNRRSLGIEHEGFVSDEISIKMIKTSAEIVAVLCKKYGIPVDREHIVGHSEVPRATHTDPGADWPWDTYLSLVRSFDVQV